MRAVFMRQEVEDQSELEQKGLLDDCPGRRYDLIVIGAGPAGLFCAMNCRQNARYDRPRKDDRRILVLEKKASPGRKLLLSGSGQCNITHEGDIRNFLDHYGEQGRFLRPAIMGFTNQDLISYFEAKGLEMEIEPGGKVFPQTRRSRDVLGILIEDCRNADVEIQCLKDVRTVNRTEEGFALLGDGFEYRSTTLVIATGGCSYPPTGSTGDGYRFARSLGHRVTEIGPALTPIIIEDYPFHDLAGISFENIKISLHHIGKTRESQGDLLFTHEGLSGPAILDLSRYVRPKDTLKLSFVPKEKRAALEEWIVQLSGKEGGRTVKSLLSEIPCSVLLPSRLIKRVVEISGIDPDLSLSQLRRVDRMHLVEILVGLPLTVSRLDGFEAAMVTRGGVDWKEVNPKTMKSRLVKGLYLAGEVLDVDGDTGGYNLQSCFSTAMLAARSIRESWDGKTG